MEVWLEEAKKSYIVFIVLNWIHWVGTCSGTHWLASCRFSSPPSLSSSWNASHLVSYWRVPTEIKIKSKHDDSARFELWYNKGGSKINPLPRSFYTSFFQDDFTVVLWWCIHSWWGSGRPKWKNVIVTVLAKLLLRDKKVIHTECISLCVIRHFLSDWKLKMCPQVGNWIQSLSK